MMRWPFMLKKTRDAEIDILAGLMQEALDNEYDRATADGRAQVHAWARELTANLYLESHPNIFRNKAMAAFQQAEIQFAPKLAPKQLEVLSDTAST